MRQSGRIHIQAIFVWRIYAGAIPHALGELEYRDGLPRASRCKPPVCVVQAGGGGLAPTTWISTERIQDPRSHRLEQVTDLVRCHCTRLHGLRLDKWPVAVSKLGLNLRSTGIVVEGPDYEVQ
ncbi:hypothetical protein NM688_g8719 [Phlebia brevispora]|uniref:Uncharacterized protein n=1 Tax=Phlebia brevispora TaxID=194682 RepID=A0ACC1RPX7_9APHY|nr:hypothetical protein NM688_g8719 [Phlebia brevispora]